MQRLFPMWVNLVDLLCKFSESLLEEQLCVLVHVPRVVCKRKEEEDRSLRNDKAPSQSSMTRMFGILDEHLAIEIVDEHVVVHPSDDRQEVIIESVGEMILPFSSILC